MGLALSKHQARQSGQLQAHCKDNNAAHDGIGNLVTNFIGVTFTNRLGGEQKVVLSEDRACSISVGRHGDDDDRVWRGGRMGESEDQPLTLVPL